MMTRRFRVVPMLQPELAKVADGRSRSASSTPGRDHQAVRLAHAASYVWDFGQEPRRGRGDYTGAHATRKRKHHDGQVRPSCDACQAGSTIAHRAVNSVPIRSQIVDGSGCICLNRKSWALNSAVECHPHTSSLSNTFNNLTRLPGTAKYLTIRSSRNVYGCHCGCLPLFGWVVISGFATAICGTRKRTRHGHTNASECVEE